MENGKGRVGKGRQRIKVKVRTRQWGSRAGDASTAREPAERRVEQPGPSRGGGIQTRAGEGAAGRGPPGGAGDHQTLPGRQPIS